MRDARMKNASRPISVTEIVAGLSALAPSIAGELFPAGRVRGNRMFIGDLNGGKGDSLAIWFGGEKPGNWRDFAPPSGAPERGDILDLVSWGMFGGDKGEAIQWAMGRLGFSGDATSPEFKQKRLDLKKQADQNKVDAAAAKARRAAMGHRLWLQASPDLAGSPVDFYLAGRGLDIRAAPSTGALRYAASLTETIHSGGKKFPAMAALVVNPAGQIVGVHRTFLQLYGGKWGKARIEDPRQALGPTSGGFVPICKGATGKSMAAAPMGDTLLICEGIEDALAIAMARPDLRIAAALHLGNMGEIDPPPAIKRLILFRDEDTKQKAREAFERARAKQAKRFADRGGELLVAAPPEGKDANDLLLAGAA